MESLTAEPIKHRFGWLGSLCLLLRCNGLLSALAFAVDAVREVMICFVAGHPTIVLLVTATALCGQHLHPASPENSTPSFS